MLVATYARCLNAVEVLDLNPYLSVFLLAWCHHFWVLKRCVRAANRVFTNPSERVIVWYLNSNLVALRLNPAVAVKRLIGKNVYLRWNILETLALQAVILLHHILAWYWVTNLVIPLKVAINCAVLGKAFIFKSQDCWEVSLKEPERFWVTHLRFSLEAFTDIEIFLDWVNNLAGFAVLVFIWRSLLVFNQRPRVSGLRLLEVDAALWVLAVHLFVQHLKLLDILAVVFKRVSFFSVRLCAFRYYRLRTLS